MSDFEIKSVAFPINENLQGEIEKLAAEGWQPLHGAEPVAVYHLMRRKLVPASNSFAEGRMLIDESKVFIRDKDGNIRSH